MRFDYRVEYSRMAFGYFKRIFIWLDDILDFELCSLTGFKNDYLMVYYLSND